MTTVWHGPLDTERAPRSPNLPRVAERVSLEGVRPVVPVERGPTPLQTLEARVAFLDAELASREASLESLDARVQALEAGAENAERSASRRHGALCSMPATEVARIPKQHFIQFDGSLSDLSTASVDAMGRALLHRDAHGNIDGYRLSGIRRGSIGDDLGLRNGDIVHAVNGHAVPSMSEAEEVLEAAKTAKFLHLELTRRGEPVDLRVYFTGAERTSPASP